MRIVLINKSDARGGAAVVTYRLMEGLRSLGIDARMLVAEKLTSSPYVIQAAPAFRIRRSFMTERLRIFAETGFDRSLLFKVDTGYCGLDLSRHPLVRSADAIFLNWVNQGFLSLDDIAAICSLGRPVIWTMHDMWCLTGICHHAGDCRRYREHCGDCPLLRQADTPFTKVFGSPAGDNDISARTHRRKAALYNSRHITFVAVSQWLGRLAGESSLLSAQDVRVIGNPFPVSDTPARRPFNPQRLELLFGAARLDDPIKGFELLVQSLRSLSQRHPYIAARTRLTTFGDIRHPELLDRLPIDSRHLGRVTTDVIPQIYADADVVLSTSYYETLPGTLVEGQAYGSIPVAFDRGGQRDIVDHLSTGFIATPYVPAEIADGIVWAYRTLQDNDTAIIDRMRQSVITKFSQQNIARRYLQLLSEKSSLIQTR